MKRFRFPLLVILIVGYPVWMRLAWQFMPSTEINLMILDKTVLTKKANEHRALSWVLNYDKIVQPNGDLYDVAKDYKGFFPQQNFDYFIDDLSTKHRKQLDTLSYQYDAVFYTDVYGIYHNEWYKEGNPSERSSLIYGGLKEQDVYLLEKMKEQKKLILTEFNLMASPTSGKQRKAVEKMFGLDWSGWAGRYFHTLDSARNEDIPPWVFRLHRKQTKQRWLYQKAGIILVHESERIVVLEEQTHLTDAMPYIITNTKEGKGKAYDLPDKVPYPFWFDITTNSTDNITISEYHLAPNEQGKALMDKYDIPDHFPALLAHFNDYRFFYMAGDFSDNPNTRTNLAKFKGITLFRGMLYDAKDKTDRQRFFWLYYQPLVANILEEYAEEMENRQPEALY